MQLINNLKIPTLLEQLILTGQWNSDNLRIVQHRVFGNGANVSLFGIDQIKRETKHMLDDYNNQVLRSNSSYGDNPYKLDADPFWFGSKDKGVLPGDLDMTQAVLIGVVEMELGIVLDYRRNKDKPSVLVSTYDLLWEKTHDDIKSLVKDLGIVN